jgi:hypothetical protein
MRYFVVKSTILKNVGFFTAHQKFEEARIFLTNLELFVNKKYLRSCRAPLARTNTLKNEKR